MVPSLSSTAMAFSALLNRRAYGAAASKGGGVWAKSSDEGGYRAQKQDHKLEGKDGLKLEENYGTNSSWSPDPVTGFYKPCNSGPDIDAAELREMVLNHRNTKPQK